MARTRPLETFGNVPKTVPREKVEDLRAEALVAAARAARPADGDRACRATCCRCTRPEARAGGRFAPLAALRLFENVGGRPHYVADYYVTLGKNGVEKTREGDQKTPIGVYHVTANLPRQKLTDFYGAGAYPINYPERVGRRAGRNGHGIWLHGTPSDTYSRPPRASDGCIVLANADLEVGRAHVQIGPDPGDHRRRDRVDRPAVPGRRPRQRSPRPSKPGARTGRAAMPGATWRTTQRDFHSGDQRPRGLGRAQAQGERRQELDQGRH